MARLPQPPVHPPVPLPQAHDAQREALFQAAARVNRHHAQKFEQRLAAQAAALAATPSAQAPAQSGSASAA